MLVLSRKLDESIVINEDIQIKVVQIRGNQIRLGVEAPRHIPIRRSEWKPSASAPVPLSSEGPVSATVRR